MSCAPKITLRSLLSPLPSAASGEVSETLAAGAGGRIERIVSHGQASPAGFWYDQDEDEWVMVLAGWARLSIEGEADELEMNPGDAVLIPAHCRHRVAWTDPDEPTVWIAVFMKADPRPAP